MPLTVTNTYRPAQVVISAEATVVADAETTPAAVITLGLAALSESPDLLFGFGIRGIRKTAMPAVLPAGEYVVYADRD